MKPFATSRIWFITGSQHLYGNEIIAQVESNSRQIAESLNEDSIIPAQIFHKKTVTTPDEITATLSQASADPACIGVICWMHTFSPAKMWINGLNILTKPFMHLHTQFNRDLPWNTIDMDFMNLNQSAHGGREFGFIGSRMRKDRTVVVGHWEEQEVRARIGSWIRAAAGWHAFSTMKVARIGDNMREVAVTEGDKVAAQMKFGYSVNGYGIGELIACINEVSDSDTHSLVDEYKDTYTVHVSDSETHESIRREAQIELGLRAFLKAGDFTAFTNTFEDLHGLPQLPGLAIQRLMADGYGFGAEGDWKTAALLRALKVMASGLKQGTSFMEDYTYHMDPKNGMVLGAHMLEVCPSIAANRPVLDVQPLGIGGKKNPVRLVFTGAAGPAINVTVIDMGNRFRMLVNNVEAIDPTQDLPRLPVARTIWRPEPDLKTAAAAWILAGGTHHTVYSQALTMTHMEDFAEMAGIELVAIDQLCTIRDLKNQLRWNDLYYLLKDGYRS